MNFFNKLKNITKNFIKNIVQPKILKKIFGVGKFINNQKEIDNLSKEEQKLERTIKKAQKEQQTAKMKELNAQKKLNEIRAGKRKKIEDEFGDFVNEIEETNVSSNNALERYWNDNLGDKALREIYHYSDLNNLWNSFIEYLLDKKGGIGKVYGISVNTTFNDIWNKIIIQHIKLIEPNYIMAIRGGDLTTIAQLDQAIIEVFSENNNRLEINGWNEFQSLLEIDDYKTAYEAWRTLRALTGENVDPS